MSGHKIIVVGASAGGVETLIQMVRGFPANLAASIFVVLHLPPEHPSSLPDILSRVGMLHALHPVDHQKIEQGHIYIAPPDHHLIIRHGEMHLVRGPKENRHRPAIDPLFRSAAVVYGPQVVGVVLTGSLDDGTAGLWAIKQRGGIAVVQDPKDAIYRSMPESALAHVKVDYCLQIAKIGPLLVRLTDEPVLQEHIQPVSKEMEQEVRIAEMETNPLSENEQVGESSRYSCPECGGVLWEVHDGELTRFRCRTGHAFSAEGVLAEQSEKMEQALWVALKTLDEKADLSSRMARQARQRGQEWLAERFEKRVQEAVQHAILLRQVLTEQFPMDLHDINSVS